MTRSAAMPIIAFALQVSSLCAQSKATVIASIQQLAISDHMVIQVKLLNNTDHRVILPDLCQSGSWYLFHVLSKSGTELRNGDPHPGVYAGRFAPLIEAGAETSQQVTLDALFEGLPGGDYDLQLFDRDEPTRIYSELASIHR